MPNKAFVYLSDVHAPFADPRCIALAVARMQFLKPSIVILGGDIMDCYLEGRFVRVGGQVQKFAEEVAATADLLDKVQAAAPRAKFYYLEGNHEFRHKVAIATMGNVPGYLEGYPGISLEDALDLKRRRIQYVHSKAGNAHLKLGPLLFTHGQRYGVNPARMELMDNLCSGVSGHVHRMTEARVSSSTSGVDWKWMTSGCLSLPAHYSDRSSEHLGFISGWLNEDSGTFHLVQETIHAEAYPHGRASLYAPEGEYYSVFSPRGYVVRCNQDAAEGASKRGGPGKVGKKR